MSLKKTLAGAMPFAHLLSNGSRAARAEGDEREEDRAEGDREEDEEARRAEREGEDDREKDDGDEEGGRKGKKARKARRADKDNNDVDGDDADAEDDENEDGAEDADDEDDTAKKAARARERVRCARIIAHGIKIGAVRQAGVFAFDTNMSSKAAIAALNAARADSAPRRESLSSRMAATRVPNPGAASAGGAPTLAEQIILAGKKRRGEI